MEEQFLFQVLANQSLVGIYLFDQQQIIYVNQTLAGLLGYTPEELIGQNVLTLVHPEDRDLVAEHIRRRLEEGVEAVRYTFRAQTRDGDTLWVEVFGQRIDHQGRPAILGLLVDVSQRMEALQGLERSEQRFQTLIEHLAEGLAVTDEAGRVVIWNRRLAALTGLEPEQVLGRFIWEVQAADLDPPDQRTSDRRQALETSLRDALATGQAPWFGRRLVRKYLHPNGGVYFLEGVLFALPGEGGFRLASLTRDVTEEQRAQAEQKRLLSLLQETLDAAETLVWRLPLDFAKSLQEAEPDRPDRGDEADAFGALLADIQVYGPAEALLGYPAQAFIQDPGLWYSRLHPEDRTETLAVVQKLLDDAKAVAERSYRWRRKDGTWIWLGERLFLERDPAGRPVALRAVTTDVSILVREQVVNEIEDRVQASLASRRPGESLGRALALLAERHPIDDAVLLVGDERAVAFHPQWIRPGLEEESQALMQDLYGEPEPSPRVAVQPNSYYQTVLERREPLYVADSAQGRYWAESVLAHHGWRTTLLWPLLLGEKENVLLALQSRQPHAFDDGELQAVLERLAPVLWGAVVTWRYEKELADLNWRLAELIEHTPEGVVLVDRQGRVVVANSVGRTDLERLGRFDEQGRLTHLGDHELEGLLALEPAEQPLEVNLDGPPPQVFELSVNLIDEAADAGSAVLLLRDVTRERETQARIQQQERLAAVGQLAAGIAHDFNNILAAIVLSTQMAARDPDLSPRTRDRLGVVLKQSGLAANLVRQILDFSRQSVHQPHPLEMSAFLKEAVKLLQRTVPESIRVNLVLETRSLWVSGDVTQLQQVLMNLAVNARDAMPQGGDLDIRLAALQVEAGGEPVPGLTPGPWAVLTVSDSGGGIPPQVLPHIFDPFFTTKAPGQGTGLGLAQVYGIVKRHGGEIQVDSQVGQGTTFSIYLPVLEREPEADPEGRAQAQVEGEAQVEPLTILVAEDNPTARAALVEALEVLGHRVFVCASGDEALARFRQEAEAIDLVLTDMVMPGMSGLELAQAVAQHPAPPPVIIMSGYSLEQGQDLEQAGMPPVAWLQKPFSVEALRRLLRDVMRP